MFSSIKYILGYTDETDTAGLAAASDATSGSEQKTNDSSVLKPETTSTTNVLEQTLNTATTKFTEQLLPPQASIEQLQSSSHQLLPSIIEQHEDEENKKLSLQSTAKVLSQDDGEDDDINVDSWELLDLVDKVGEDAGARSSLIKSYVQEDEVPVTTQAAGLSKSTSGILKSSSGGSSSSSGGKPNDNDNNSQSRQKQKVSFETPDLVKYKQEIEQTKPKEQEQAVASAVVVVAPGEVDSPAAIAPVSDSKRNKRSKKVKNSKVQGANVVAGSKCDKFGKLEVRVKVVADADKKSSIEKVCEQNVTGNQSSNPSATGEEKQLQVRREESESTAKVVPVLNYAKALSAKPKARVTDISEVKKEEEVNVAKQASKQSTGASSQMATSGVQSGPVKRSRPLSTSSWSSNDDLEAMDRNQSGAAIDSTKEPSCAVVAGPSIETARPVAQNLMHEDDDNESLISSGFSDCDYGFGGLNDYIMRPKKAYSKRGHSGSGGGNSSSIVGMKSRRSDGSTSSANRLKQSLTKSAKPIATEGAKGAVQQPSVSSKNTKPKKKRMIMATSKMVGSSSDFLKQKRQNDAKSKTATENKQSSRNGSSESSDIAEMDESWFVTPPPCFTGAAQSSKGVELPKAKEAARENALIEHPSIYIASTSRDSLKVKFTAKSVVLPEVAPKSNEVVSKKVVVALEDSAWASDEEDDLSETMSLGRPSDVEEAPVLATGSFDEVRNAEDEDVSLSAKQERPVATDDAAVESANARETRGTENTRPATQVRPIEPERRPGWQLKRQRSKRRSPLKVATASAAKQQVASEPKPSPASTDRSSASNSAASSSRSTPTLMDRIGTSIVANLTNLTSGLVSSGAVNYRPNGRDPNMLDSSAQGPLSNKTNSLPSIGQMSRKQMSRRSLKRQNDCTKQGNSLRRPDRRLKMFTTPNGCSVNRKVHTSIH